MTDETAPDEDAPRRKFDEIASLFGGIVPAPGATLRPAEDRPPPFPLQSQVPTGLAQTYPDVVPLPGAVKEPEPGGMGEPSMRQPGPIPQPGPMPVIAPHAGGPAFRAETVPPAPTAPTPAPTLAAARGQPPALRLEPKPTARPRPRPTEVPWPDAFEPRANFRRRQPRNWTWLLLIPVGIVAAFGITQLDPRAIREWLSANVLHRTPVQATTAPPVVTPTTTPTPQAATPPAEAPVLYPAIPTSPVPVPPGTEVSPPPPDPADAAAAAAVPAHITIQYRRNIPGSDGEARRMAALLQSFGGSIELHPTATTVRTPTIIYYNATDKTAAAALATALGNEASSWTVRLGTGKNPPGTLEVWLP